MSGGEATPLFTPEDMRKMAAEAEDAQREAYAYCEWLRSPEGKAWTAQQIQEATAIAEEFKAEIEVGKYDLAPAELEQLRRDGIFVSHRKKGEQP